jgi:hypothetical protein|tara:strand:+ start:1896 stop:2282 length:387 start_codon:yes stop_codon:yes gene_type:complete
MKKTKHYANVSKKDLVKKHNAWKYNDNDTVSKPIYVDDNNVPHYKYDNKYIPIVLDHYGYKTIDTMDNPVYHNLKYNLNLVSLPRLSNGAKYKITVQIVDDNDVDVDYDSAKQFADGVRHNYSAFNQV